ncbi:MAG TPA: phage major capsid protein [Bryobacteraceae bacterium]|nr:phage major capsid protein [Bryobacteraceae bacterium]
MPTMLELKEKRLKLISDAQAILLSANPTSEQRSRATAIMNDCAAVEKDIDALETLAAKASEARAAGIPAYEGNSAVNPRQRAEVRAFEKYIRFGKEELDREERALLRERRDITLTGTTGVLVPQLFLPTLIAAQKLVGNSVSYVRKKVTNNNGAPMRIALANDTVNTLTTLTAETTVVGEQDPAFNGFISNTDTVATLVKVSIQELEDSAFDLNEWMRDAFGLRYYRGLEYLLSNGNGSNVASMVAGATLGATMAANTGPTYDDFCACYGALEPAYIANGRWVMNQATRVWVMGQKDTLGRPLFIPSPNTGTLDYILGLPICLNQALPVATTPGATGVLLGDLQQGYLLRTDGDVSIRRLDERFVDTLEVGFLAYARIGGYSTDAGTHPILKMVTHT